MCLAEGSCGLSGDKRMRTPGPHTPLSSLDPASWAEPCQALLVPTALKRVGCESLGMQEFRDMNMQGYGDTGTQGGGDTGLQGYGSDGCVHTSPDAS